MSTRQLRDIEKLKSHAGGIAARLAPPSQQALREFIAAQTCPWCDAGPFQVLATHTRRAHGVSGVELRELAGLGKFASICAEDHSAAQATRLAGKRLPDHAYGEAQRKPRTLSAAGRAAQRDRAAKVSQSDRERAARIGGDKQLAANSTKHAAIVRLFNEGVPLLEIAESTGVSQPTVRRTLRREGIYVDGRSRRWQV